MNDIRSRREFPTPYEQEVIDKITQVVVARGGRVFPSPDEATLCGYTRLCPEISLSDIETAFGRFLLDEFKVGNWGVTDVRYGIDEHLANNKVDVWTIPRDSDFARTPKRVTATGTLLYTAATRDL